MALTLIDGRIYKAFLHHRDNRFVTTCSLDGRTVKAHLPNPGRLWELFFPGAELVLRKNPNPAAKLEYTVMAVKKEDAYVFLHTHMGNTIAGHLIEQGLIEGLDGYSIEGREVTHGSSRFDFLLTRDGVRRFCEVKSCSLFHKAMAMFPDAPTSRGTRHIRELASLEMEKGGYGKGIALILVQDRGADYFLPEYHTDPAFAAALYESRERISIIPAGISVTGSLTLAPEIKNLAIPWHLYEQERGDRGAYMIILRLEQDMTIRVGKLGELFFKQGWYVYTGSAKKNLTKRIERHKRLRKNFHWHIDYLREHSRFTAAIPVRTSNDIECALARKVSAVAGWNIRAFGSSDCSCDSHLCGFEQNPLDRREFVQIILHYRMELPVNMLR